MIAPSLVAEELTPSLESVARRMGIPCRSGITSATPSAEFVERVPIHFARQFLVLGLAEDADILTLALGGEESWPAIDTVARWLRRPVTPVLAPPEQVRMAINAAYERRTGQAEHLLEKLSSTEAVLAELHRLPPREDLLNTADRAPVVRLVNTLLFEAVTSLASDVHIQPYEDRLVARLRIDGMLYDAHTIPKAFQEEVISRIKVVGKMNIAEKRLPQDGRATVEVGDRLIDLRIASLPTSHGERVVIRLLDKSARLYSLGELGMSPESLGVFRRLIRMEHGILLVTGPTGSGKSTTLYAALSEVDRGVLNVVTLEDPIEYQLDGISQTQINTKKGMTFASGLRSVLRQDPDIIMVGEIRDQETAVMAIQSALTGHLVLSTLHTNDAASAVTRLLDLGIEPYLAADSLNGVLAQRLVRRNCPHCSQPVELPPEDLRKFGVTSGPPTATPRRGAGCPTCRDIGYRGRFAISELLVCGDAVRSLIHARAPTSQILETAVLAGMQRMRDDGFRQVLLGTTTLDEVARVTMQSVDR